jgi:mono/diheme cytochrome c family protein
VAGGRLARVPLDKLMTTVPRAVLAWGIAAGLLMAHQVRAEGAEAVSRGAYLFRIGGCQGCHTDVKNKGTPLAGGRALATPFGTFYGPNITAHPKAGIGGWSDQDFVRALREGISPPRRTCWRSRPTFSPCRRPTGRTGPMRWTFPSAGASS